MRLTPSEQGRQNVSPELNKSAIPSVLLNLAAMARARRILLLMISTAFSEVASNVVYVVLIERAFQLGNGATSIGLILIFQAAAQVVLGFWAGGVADRWGYKYAASTAALINVPLVIALAISQNLVLIYFLAILLMLARLLLIPARFGLVTQLSDKSRLAEVNTVLLIIAGLGSFVGPAIAATLLFGTDDFRLALLVAGVGWLLSVPPMLLIRVEMVRSYSDRLPSFFDVLRVGWHQIRKRNTINQVLVCLVLVALCLGGITPLFSPLSRLLGLGSEGTGIFFSALGFGYLVGPVVATALFKRLSLATTLLIAGLLAPVGLILVGALKNLAVVLVAIALVSAAGAGVNVIVTTVTQRLTAAEHQGSVLGTEQTIIGLTWIVSLSAITGITAVWKAEPNAQILFLIMGSVGFVSILGCWIWNKRSIQAACGQCEPRFRLSPVVCGAMQGAPFNLSGAGCYVICGEACQCCA